MKRVFLVLAAGMAVSAGLLLLGVTVRGESRAPEDDRPHLVFVIGESEYQTEVTLPAFAERYLEPLGFRTTIVRADEKDPNHFPGLSAVREADLLVLSVRRRTPSEEQMALIRGHLKTGKPLLAIRTSSHAFALRRGEPPAGHVQWPRFDREVLGGRYNLHYGNDETRVKVADDAKHPILTGLEKAAFPSPGSLYKSLDLAPETELLLLGSAKDKDKEVSHPVAWTNRYGKSRVFYTSLGHPGDFQRREFRRLLANAVFWCLGKQVPDDVDVGSDAAQRSRERINEAVAGNDQVLELMKRFKGRGVVGDDSEPTPPEEAVKLFEVTEPLEMELVAAEPTIEQPLYMSWDERGRLWVVQYRQYPFPAGLKVVKYDQYLRAVFDKVPQPPPNHVQGRDKITVLEDTDGDGKYDSAKDVITGLNIATSVVTGRGGIWVLNPPYLLFYPDADRDDVPDGDPEVHLSGFGLEDTHSVANSLRWGPDGWLYGANGSTTTGTINSAVTRNVHYKGQMIWRYHPETRVFEIFAEGGGNTFSLDIDSKGRVFSGTNHGGTRGMHYAQGGYAEKNWGKHGPLTNPYAFGYYGHMRHEGFTERFSQTFAIYEGGTFPAKYDGWVISADALHNRVLASRRIRDTSTFRTVDAPPLVTTPDRWFRPVDLKVGPDGAVYLADWYDSRLTHVDPRDNWHKTSGRIHRLKPKGAQPLEPFDLAKLSSAELIERFDHPNKWFRQTAVRVLGDRGDRSVLPHLRSILAGRQERALEALWAIHRLDGLTDEVARTALEHEDPHVRRWGVRLLGDRRKVSPEIGELLAEMAKTESDAEVRSQLASTAKRLPVEHALPIIRALLGREEDVDDLHIPLLIWWALEAKAESDRAAVLELFEERELWDLPMARQFILSRIMQRYAMPGGEENLETCAKLLALAPGTEETKRLMAGLEEAFRGRRIDRLPPALKTALEEYQKSIGNSDIALGLRLGKKEAVEEALRTVADEKAELAKRLAYIEILGQVKAPQAMGTLLGLLGRSGSHSVKRVALQALMSYDDPAIGQRIARLYHRTLPDEHGLRETAQRVLASRREWALALLEEVDEWRIKRQTVSLDVVEQMALHGDPEIDALIKKHWGRIRGGTPAEKQEEMRHVASLLREDEGNLESGRKLFMERCGKCHTLFGEGGQTGPKLTGYERTNLGFLLLAVVDPSAAIREEFTNFAITTLDGRTLTGLIVDQDTRTVTLRGVNNEKTIISRDDIDTLQALPVSIMPDGLLKKLSDEQVRDLFAYLMSRSPTDNAQREPVPAPSE